MTLDPLSIRKGDKFTVEFTAVEDARLGHRPGSYRTLWGPFRPV